MLISSINPYYYKTSNRSVYSVSPKVHPSFCGINSTLSYQTRQTVSSINYSIEDIVSKLARKTDEGLRFLQEAYPNFSIEKGLVFHNCGDKNSSIAVKLNKNNLTKIIVRQGNSTHSKRRVLDAFLIKDSNKLVSNFDRTHLIQFPDQCEFYTDKESAIIEERLKPVLEDLDFSILQFKKFLNKHLDDYLKPFDGILPMSLSDKIAKTSKMYKNVDSLLGNESRKSTYNLKLAYPDYLNRSGQDGHVLTNIGPEKLTIAYTHPQSTTYTNLTKMLVYDSDGNIINGFLIDNGEKLVKNYNINYPNVFPPKLTYVDAQNINNPENLPLFDKYLSMYQEKLSDFRNFIIKSIQVKTPQLNQGTFSDENILLLNKILKTYQDIEQQFEPLWNVRINKIKSQFPSLSHIAGKHGLTFNTFETNKSVTILPLKSKQENNLLRLTIFDNEHSNVYLIKDCNKIVKNYNPEYPTVIPPVLKYMSQSELDRLNLEPCFKYLLDRLETFNDFIITEQQKLSLRKSEKELNKQRIEFEKANKVKEYRSKNFDYTKMPEYKILMKECNQELSNAMKNISNNLDDFNSTLLVIKQKVEEFFADKLNK